MRDSTHNLGQLANEENALFDKWKHRYGHGTPFVSDGAVDPDQYARSSIRLLFVLKEANDEGGTWDLRRYLRDEGRGYTWNTVTRWVEGILQLPRVVPWRELNRQPDDGRRQRALRKVVTVNLKKRPGGSSTDESEIREAARRDRDLILAQLSLYTPDFVICCGDVVASSLADDVYEPPVSTDAWRTTSRGVWFHLARGIPHVCVYHPAARFPARFLHYELLDAV